MILSFYLQAVLIPLALVLSWWRGSHEHRWVSSTIATMFILTTVIAVVGGQVSDFSGIPIHRVALDVMAFGIFLRLWLGSNSWWMLWVCSAQLLSVLAHLARIMALPLPPIGYAVMEMWPVWFVVITTLAAVSVRIVAGRDNR